MTKRRRPWLAALLSVLAPALGHVYAGRPGRGVVVGLAYLAGVLGLMLLASRARSALALMALLAALGVAYVLVARDAFRIARRAGDAYPLAWFNRWWGYALVLVVLLVVQGLYGRFVRREIVQAFRLPSGAMAPTLLIGDHFLVDKRAYRVGDPQRLDVVVFESPADRTTLFVKRILGLPGDTIEIRDKIVRLNGAPLDEPYATRSDRTDEKSPASADHGPLTVPAGHYFILGDNRDASLDSRAVGPIPREKIFGRARILYWSWDHAAGAVRWDRIGLPVR